MDKLDYGYWNMDCMEGMKRFPDKYFEVAIVDPPYGINAPTSTSDDPQYQYYRVRREPEWFDGKLFPKE